MEIVLGSSVTIDGNMKSQLIIVLTASGHRSVCFLTLVLVVRPGSSHLGEV